MEVTYSCSNGLLTMNFIPQTSEGIDVIGKAKMGRRTCRFYLPEDWTLSSIHPDVMALAIIMLAYPFAGSTIKVPAGVSRVFHDQFKASTGRSIVPVDPMLQPRKAPRNAKPGLAYSGGADSTAMLAVMPKDTCCFFIDRIQITGKSLYKKEAAYYSCDLLKKLGHHVIKVRTDFEYLREPAGFPVEYTTTVPALLLADYFGLDSVVTGTTREFYIGNPPLFKTRMHSIRWEGLFEAVSTPLNSTAGELSEVANYKILLSSPYSSVAQPCIRGGVNSPCMNCYKCFRKTMLEMTVSGKPMENRFLDRLFSIKDARNNLRTLPAKFENVLTYITAHYHGKHPLMNLLKKKTRGGTLDVSWMEKWQRPAPSKVATKHQDQIERTVSQYLETATPKDIVAEKGWSNMRKVVATPEYLRNHQQFVRALDRFVK